MRLIVDATNYLKSRLPEKVQFNISHKDLSINVPVSGVLFNWVIENICKNAVDAMGVGGGEIMTLISRGESGIILDIRDTGKGIPRKDWKNIFRPGYSSKHRGWGLGLSLTQRIIEEIHGGSIRVLSSKLGETVFRLNFPV